MQPEAHVVEWYVCVCCLATVIYCEWLVIPFAFKMVVIEMRHAEQSCNLSGDDRKRDTR